MRQESKRKKDDAMVSLLYTEVMKLHFEYDATAPNNLRWVWLSYKA